MEESTKKMLEKAGKIFLGIAEAGASSMQSTANSYSRNKKIPEEYREKYSEMAIGLGEIKSALHDYKERIGSAPNSDDDYDTDEFCYEDDSDDDAYDEGACDNLSVVREKNPQQKNYINLEKAIQQAESATKASEDFNSDEKCIAKEWKELGYLKDIECEKISEEGVGVVRLILADEVVYIVRAIELNNGGISRKIKELQEYEIKRKPRVYVEIGKNIDKIKVDIICLGNDENAVANSRKLEKKLIQEHNPIWL